MRVEVALGQGRSRLGCRPVLGSSRSITSTRCRLRGSVIMRCSPRPLFIFDFIVIARRRRHVKSLAALDCTLSLDGGFLLLVRGLGLFEDVKQVSALQKRRLLGCEHLAYGLRLKGRTWRRSEIFCAGRLRIHPWRRCRCSAGNKSD